MITVKFVLDTVTLRKHDESEFARRRFALPLMSQVRIKL